MSMTTRHLICLALLSCTLFTACGPGERQPEDGFDFKDNVDRSTTLVGLVTDKTNQPISNVTVYIRRDEQTLHTTTTDSRGQFTIEAQIVGSIKLVLNDGRGFGAVIDVVLFEGGQNDAGTISLVPLETIDGIVDVFDVGFEERLTRESGNYQLPVYNKDASIVFAARKKNPELAWDIVRIETSSGQETVLVKDVHLERYYSAMRMSNRPHREQFFELLLDRYLYYTYNYLNADNQKRYGHVLFDTVTKTSLFDSAQYPEVQYTSLIQERLVPVAVGRRIYMPLNIGNQRREDFPSEYKKRKVFFVFDADNQRISQSEELASYWHSALTVIGHNDTSIIYSGVSLEHEPHTFIFDTITGESTNLRSGGKGIRSDQQVISGDGQVVILENRASFDDYPQTHVVSLQTGNIEVFEWTMLSKTDQVNTLAVNRAGTEAIVEAIGRDAISRPTLYLLNTTTMNVTPFTLDVTFNGQSNSICDGEDTFKRVSECDVFYDSSDQLFARGVFKDSKNQWQGVDIHNASKTPQASIYPLPGEPSWKELYVVPEHRLASKLSKTLRILRQPDTGFSQLYTHVSNQLIQRTHLRADHHDMALSADGQYVFYFTTDPISGYEQLFRLRLLDLN